MKKAILGLAFLTIVSVSFSAGAQQASATCAKTECKIKKECNKICNNKDCKNCKDCKDCKACCKKGAQEVCVFDGLNLTDTQKGQIEALNKAVKVSRQELAAKAKESKEVKTDMRKQNKAIREQYIKDLGNILNSDQYVKFLQNYYVNTPDHHKRMGKASLMKHKGHKGQKGKMRPQGQKNPKLENGSIAGK